MNAPMASTSSRSPALALIGRVLRWLDAVPYTILALPLRLAAATVFWNSGTTKLANWDTALALFSDEYKVPLLPPELAGLSRGLNRTDHTRAARAGLADAAGGGDPARHGGLHRSLRLPVGVADPPPVGSDAARPALSRSGSIVARSSTVASLRFTIALRRRFMLIGRYADL